MQLKVRGREWRVNFSQCYPIFAGDIPTVGKKGLERSGMLEQLKLLEGGGWQAGYVRKARGNYAGGGEASGRLAVRRKSDQEVLRARRKQDRGLGVN